MANINKVATVTTGFSWQVREAAGRAPVAEGKGRRFKKSGDPKLSGQEVHETYAKDKRADRWDHIVKDAATGEVIHEEYMRLSDKIKSK